jgi:hypothetical protein
MVRERFFAARGFTMIERLDTHGAAALEAAALAAALAEDTDPAKLDDDNNSGNGSVHCRY